jgi:hypothetical protein
VGEVELILGFFVKVSLVSFEGDDVVDFVETVYGRLPNSSVGTMAEVLDAQSRAPASRR